MHLKSTTASRYLLVEPGGIYEYDPCVCASAAQLVRTTSSGAVVAASPNIIRKFDISAAVTSSFDIAAKLAATAPLHSQQRAFIPSTGFKLTTWHAFCGAYTKYCVFAGQNASAAEMRTGAR
jgi:hypothetical protein